MPVAYLRLIPITYLRLMHMTYLRLKHITYLPTYLYDFPIMHIILLHCFRHSLLLLRLLLPFFLNFNLNFRSLRPVLEDFFSFCGICKSEAEISHSILTTYAIIEVKKSISHIRWSILSHFIKYIIK
jgi:hypothetical protein